MSQIEIVPCSLEDWQEFTLMTLMGEPDLMSGSENEIQQRILPDAYTLLIDGKMAACGGITANWSPEAPNQVGTAWLRMADSGPWQPSLRVQVAYRVRQRLYTSVRLRPYQMVEANVNRYDLRAQRFVQWMRFQFRGMREGFGPRGEDMILYGLWGSYVRT